MMEIKQMARCHIAQVAELEKICFADPWSEKSIASELENPLSYWLVALDLRQRIGQVVEKTADGRLPGSRPGRL